MHRERGGEGEFYLHKGAQTDFEARLAPKWYVPKAGHAPPAGVDVKNEWIYTPCSHVFMVCVCMNNFTFIAAPETSSIRSSSEYALRCLFLLLCKKGPEAVDSGNLSFAVFVVGPVGPTTNTARLSPRYGGKTRGCYCSQ